MTDCHSYAVLLAKCANNYFPENILAFAFLDRKISRRGNIRGGKPRCWFLFFILKKRAPLFLLKEIRLQSSHNDPQKNRKQQTSITVKISKRSSFGDYGADIYVWRRDSLRAAFSVCLLMLHTRHTYTLFLSAMIRSIEMSCHLIGTSAAGKWQYASVFACLDLENPFQNMESIASLSNESPNQKSSGIRTKQFLTGYLRKCMSGQGIRPRFQPQRPKRKSNNLPACRVHGRPSLSTMPLSC